jgi:hypothetical protein
MLVDAASAVALPQMTKRALADQILDRVRALLVHAGQRLPRDAEHEAPN